MAFALCTSAVDASIDCVMGLASTVRRARSGKPVRLLAIANAVADVVLAHAASRVARMGTADDPQGVDAVARVCSRYLCREDGTRDGALALGLSRTARPTRQAHVPLRSRTPDEPKRSAGIGANVLVTRATAPRSHCDSAFARVASPEMRAHSRATHRRHTQIHTHANQRAPY